MIFFGICLLILAATVVTAFREYRSGAHAEAFRWLFVVLLCLSLSYAGERNRELVKRNMKKFGLKPDRDEGPASL